MKQMKSINNLTLSQKIALEGEIAAMFIGVPHEEEIKYRLYMVLKNLQSFSNEKYEDYVIEALKNTTPLNDCEFQRVLWEAGQEEPPLWIWVDKCIADIKTSVRTSEYSYIQGGASPSKNKDLKKMLVLSCFCKFVRAVAFCCSQAARALMLAIKEDKELEFLHIACTYELEELARVELARPPKSKIPSTIMDMCILIDPANVLSFTAETNALKRSEQAAAKNAERAQKLMSKAGDKKDFIEALDEVISSIVGETIEELADERKNISITSKARYIVTKKFNGSDLAVPLRDFKTKGEALEFIAELNKNFPELKKTCTFEITREERNK